MVAVIADPLPAELVRSIQGRSLPRVPFGQAETIIRYCAGRDVAVAAMRGMVSGECAQCTDVQLVPDVQVVFDATRLAKTSSSWSVFRHCANQLAISFLRSLPAHKRKLQIAFDFYTEEDWRSFRTS